MRISDWSSDVCSSDLAAKARGVQFGRRPTLTPGQVEHARELLGEGRTATETAELLGVHRATLYRALRGPETSQAEPRRPGAFAIGREACRERACQYVEYPEGACSLKKKK